MPTTSKAAPAATPAGRAATTPTGPSPILTVLCAWFIPGAGQFLQGEVRKAAILGGTLIAMFIIGLALSGRLFAFDTSEPLIFLAAGAEWVLGLPRLIGAMGGLGRGIVTEVGFEYGNTFLISAGLLNVLVMLDAFDRASGRKTR